MQPSRLTPEPSRDETPSFLHRFLFENLSETEVFAPRRAAPALPFSPERFAERDKHPEFLGGCVFSKTTPGYLNLKPCAAFSPDDYAASPTEAVKTKKG